MSACRDQPIMLLFLTIMLCCSALLPIMLKNKNCGQTIMLFMYKVAEAINYM